MNPLLKTALMKSFSFLFKRYNPVKRAAFVVQNARWVGITAGLLTIILAILMIFATPEGWGKFEDYMDGAGVVFLLFAGVIFLFVRWVKRIQDTPSEMIQDGMDYASKTVGKGTRFVIGGFKGAWARRPRIRNMKAPWKWKLRKQKKAEGMTEVQETTKRRLLSVLTPRKKKQESVEE